MKKFIVLSLLGLLIMAFSATVYAQKLDFKASGFIDAIGVYNKNVPRYNASAGTFQVVHPDYGNYYAAIPPTAPVGLDAKALNKKETFATSRLRLKFDAVMDKNLSGTIFFEADSTRWGDISGGQGGKLRESGAFGYWSADRVAFEIKNCYIDFGLPYFGIPVPMSFRVGLQPLSIRPDMVVYTDGMGVTGNFMVANMIGINPLWFKALEGKDWADDDVDVYGLQVTAKIAPFTFGGYGLYYNMKTYPFTVATAVKDLAGTAYSIPSLYQLVQGTMTSGMWWLGAYADGKAGPVNFNFDFVYDRGKVQQHLLTTIPPMPDVKYRGWATKLKIDFPWDIFNFGAVGMYATGADAKKTSAAGLPGQSVAYGAGFGGGNPYTAMMSKKNTAYVVPPGSEEGPIFGEAMVVYNGFCGVSDPIAIGANANYNALSKGAIGGTAMAKLYASVKPIPWWKVTLQGLYVWDTTKNGNTFGNAVNYLGYLRNDKDIGFELDLINEISIYKNLVLYLGGGYLWAGDALDLRDTRSAARGLLGNINLSPKNPWILATKLQYTF